MPKVNVSQYVAVIDMPRKRLGWVAIVGLGVGAMTWLLSLLMQAIFVEPVFCRSTDSFTACANGGTISIVIALILAHTAGLFALVRINVYRPLLVVLATLITLYGIHSWLGALSWYEATMWYALLTTVLYVLYAWIARLSSFFSALVLMAVTIVVVRIFMTQL